MATRDVEVAGEGVRVAGNGSTRVRRALGVLVPAALCVTAVGFYTSAPAVLTLRTGSPSPTSPSTVRPSASPTPTSASPSSPASADSTSPPAGPGVTEPGIMLVAQPQSDGTFDVSEMVMLEEPTTELDLRPPRVSRAGDSFADLEPVASQVQVSADGGVVSLPDAEISDRTRVDVAVTSRFELRYTLSGVSVRSIPSSAGRALAVLAPLTQVDGDLPVSVTVVGDAVRNLQCPRLSDELQACAAGDLPRLTVAEPLPSDDALVLVQLDLPRPR